MQVRDSNRVLHVRSSEPLGELSLEELVETVMALNSVPTLKQVEAWFSSLLIRQRDYEQHRFFSDHKYARNLVVRSQYAEMLLLCWRQGQRTPIHDHGGSIGVVLVCEGMMTETMFERAPEGHVKPHNTYRRGPGVITGADVPDIHQLLNLEQDGRDLVTLHCYAPPLSVLNTYSQHSSKVKHWRELYFSGGAGI
jgi:cysteine dioxygenase